MNIFRYLSIGIVGTVRSKAALTLFLVGFSISGQEVASRLSLKDYDRKALQSVEMYSANREWTAIEEAFALTYPPGDNPVQTTDHLVGFLPIGLFANESTTDQPTGELLHYLVDVDLRTLSNIKISTPTRHPVALDQASSVFSLITAEEIEAWGIENVREALDRTTGFFYYSEWDANIGHRGFGNNLLLYMIDGQRINNKSVRGLFQLPLFPNLNMVKQIEVVKDPASTLWGSDATLGIINLVTYEPRDLIESLDQTAASFRSGYNFETERFYTSIMAAGIVDEEVDYLIVLNYAESDGEILDRYIPGPGGPVRPQDIGHFQPKANSYNSYFPSYEFYSKINLGDFSLKTRYYDWDETYAGNAGQYGNRYHRMWEHYFVTLGYSSEIISDWTVKVELSYEDSSSEQYWPNPSVRTSRYNGYNLDLLTIYAVDGNTLRLGGNIGRTKFDAVREIGLEVDPYNPAPPQPAPFGNIPQSPSGIEYAGGLFIEDEYRGIDQVSLTAGLRYDFNDFRGDDGGWYPRFAAGYDFTEAWALRYFYSTGVSYPLVEQMWGSFSDRVKANWDPNLNVIGASGSQRSYGHDLQLSYSVDRLRLTLTPYQLELHDYIEWPGNEEIINGERFLFGSVNTGDIQSRGIEFAGTARPFDQFEFYGNTSYNRTKLKNRIISVPGSDFQFDASERWDQVDPDLNIVSSPRYLWNLGCTWYPLEKFSLNLHYRGWDGMFTRLDTNSSAYEEFGPEHFLDASASYRNLFLKGLSLTLYGRNIGKNDFRLPTNGSGYNIEQGFHYGVALTFKRTF